MSELSFEQMFEESSFKRLRTGEAVTGQVIGVKEDEIILSIAGSKSEGIITRSEFTNEPGVDLRTKVQVGDELEAKVLKVNDGEGMAALSYKRLAADKGLKRLKEAFENKEVLKEKVTQVMEKGLVVEVEGTRVFIPASMVSDTYDKDLSKYAGQEIEFVVTEFNRTHMADCLYDIARSRLALGTDHRSTFLDPAQRLSQVSRTADKRNLELCLVNMVHIIRRR